MVYDQILFGLTSAASLIAAVVIIPNLVRSGGLQRLLWIVSFGILSVLAAGVALNGLGVLSQPLVNPASSLIPGFLAAGLLWAWKRRVGTYYLSYIVAIFTVLLAATLLANALPILFVVFVHFPSGLVIFLLPLYTAFAGKTRWSSLLVGIGGSLIGFGGMGLATLTAGVPILPAAVVLDLLAPIFLAMTLLLAIGILTTPGWGNVE